MIRATGSLVPSFALVLAGLCLVSCSDQHDHRVDGATGGAGGSGGASAGAGAGGQAFSANAAGSGGGQTGDAGGHAGMNAVRAGAGGTTTDAAAAGEPDAAARAPLRVAAQEDSNVQVYSVDRATGALTKSGPPVLACTGGPLQLLADRAQRFLFGACPADRDASSRGLVSFRIDRRTGQLTRAGLATGGSPAGLGVHPSGKFVLVADYGGGATLYEIATDGTPKNVQHVEAGALPHGAVFEGSGRFAYVTNSGSNSIQQFAFDGSRLAPLKPPTASFVDDEPVFQGMKEPRYLVATPDGRFVYVVGQRPPSVFQYTVGANGGLIKAARGVSALSGPLTSDLFGKDVLLAPDGEHLYATVYANDTIARFAVARPTGSLSFEASSSSGGMGPTQLAVDPAGEILFVALATSQRISSFRVAPSTGALTPASSVPSGGNAIAAFVLNE